MAWAEPKSAAKVRSRIVEAVERALVNEQEIEAERRQSANRCLLVFELLVDCLTVWDLVNRTAISELDSGIKTETWNGPDQCVE
jgi:hypothetical protein